MSENTSEKYEKVQTKIDKTINPYLTVKIAMPEDVDKEAFLKLETDAVFLEFLKREVEAWLKRSG